MCDKCNIPLHVYSEANELADLIIRKKILYRKFSSKLTEFRNKYNEQRKK